MHPSTHTAPSALLQDAGRADIFQTLIRFAILCAFAAMAAMAWTRNVNWDEFYFLSHVHAHLNGHLDRPLQTVFVHAFGWLAAIPGTEIDQITAARLVMLAFFGGSCFALHRIAASLTDRASADIAVLAFVTSGFAIAHGGSFRADPMAAGLLMGALAFVMTTQMRLWQGLCVAILCAFALLVTVKSALYFPVFIAALVWRWEDWGVVLRSLAAAVLALGIAGVLFYFHAAGITPTEGAAATENLSEAASVSLGGSGFLPRWPELSLWLMFSAGAVALAVAGIIFAPNKRLMVVLALFALPLLSVVIYRNAFPYFFPFAVPMLMVAVAFGAHALRGGLIWKLSLMLMLASGVIQTQRALSEGNAAQRATLAEVHHLFPAPARYIDQNGMISSFEREGFFMSTWGIATYRAAGVPVFADLIDTTRPPLLLANRAELRNALRPAGDDGQSLGLMPQDAQTLRDSYVHLNGVIWLAGQDVTLENGVAEVRLPMPGAYRVETGAAIAINGRPAQKGDVLTLGQETLEITGPQGNKVRLIWNTAGRASQTPLPETGLYAGFWRL